ncbi:phosphotransferase family protein [Halobacterium yunchengense]|uniref:phosphotransferase family protein n=1 Tax=Halobacterium yunchengense TaxID=3108497 RepID=UPI003009AD3F
MSDPLQAAVRAAFPRRSVAEVDERDTRPGNRTARVAFTDGDAAYVKTATDGTRRLVRETAATRYADAHCDVETPSVLAAAPDSDPPYLATEPVRGRALAASWPDADTEERAAMVRRTGATIAAVHDAGFERSGRIAGGGPAGLDLEAAPWSETLAATVEERAADLFADRFADLPGELAAVVRDAADLLDDAPAALLHGDPSRSNCLLDPPGLLDWERAMVGDPALDVVDAASHLAEQPDVEEADRAVLRDALHDGYRSRAGGLPEGFAARRPVYRAVAFLLTPQTFELWAPQVDRPTGDLAAWVREEFQRRLDDARAAAASA